MRRIVFILLLFCASAAGSNIALADTTRIAAASSMRFVLDELLGEYAASTGDSTIQAVYGSSGNLYRQILQGAPFEMFLSADESLAGELDGRGKTVDTAVFGHGQLVLYSTADIPSDTLLKTLLASVDNGKFNGAGFRIAIANPAHAPFGKAARQALQTMGLWSSVQRYLVIADKVSQAAQFAQSREVPFALIANSLSTGLEGVSVAIDKVAYSPVRLTLSVLSASDSTRRFSAFLKEEAAQEIIARFGLLAADATD